MMLLVLVQISITDDEIRSKLNGIEMEQQEIKRKLPEIGQLLGQVGGHVIPTSDETYDLGSSTYKFRTLYLAGDTIKLGDSDIKSDSDGNISVFDGGTTTLKKLIVDELEIGSGTDKVLLLKYCEGDLNAQTLNKNTNAKGGAKLNLSNNTTAYII